MSEVTFSVGVECSACGHKFAVAKDAVLGNGTARIESGREVKLNGRNYFLTLASCPVCGAQHTLQVDNDKTFSYLSVVSDAIRHGMECSEDEKPKYSAQYRMYNQKLEEERLKISKELDGKTVSDSNGNRLEVRLYEPSM